MLLTVEQAAKYLDITTRTVYRLVSTGKLVGHQMGGALTIREKDAEAYLKERALPALPRATPHPKGPPLNRETLVILARDRLPLPSQKTKRGPGRPRKGAEVRQVCVVRLPPGLVKVATGQAGSLTAAVEQALIEWLRRKVRHSRQEISYSERSITAEVNRKHPI